MNTEFKQYKRKSISEMRPVTDADIRAFESDKFIHAMQDTEFRVSISDADKENGSPKIGDMIARNPKNHNDQWLVAKAYFDDNLEEVTTGEKTFHNTDASGASKNVKDIIFWGNGDTFKLISKASSKNEGWMKSTKAMQIDGIGCVVQVTTQQGNNVAEALTFVPSSIIVEEYDNEGKVIGRKLEVMQ